MNYINCDSHSLANTSSYIYSVGSMLMTSGRLDRVSTLFLCYHSNGPNEDGPGFIPLLENASSWGYTDKLWLAHLPLLSPPQSSNSPTISILPNPGVFADFSIPCVTVNHLSLWLPSSCCSWNDTIEGEEDTSPGARQMCAFSVLSPPYLATLYPWPLLFFHPKVYLLFWKVIPSHVPNHTMMPFTHTSVPLVR